MRDDLDRSVRALRRRLRARRARPRRAGRVRGPPADLPGLPVARRRRAGDRGDARAAARARRNSISSTTRRRTPCCPVCCGARGASARAATPCWPRSPAVAAACLVALVVVLWPDLRRPRCAGAAGSARRRGQPHHGHRRAACRKPWGTEIDVHCRYSESDTAGTHTYGLQVVDKAGKVHPRWVVDAGRRAQHRVHRRHRGPPRAHRQGAGHARRRHADPAADALTGP